MPGFHSQADTPHLLFSHSPEGRSLVGVPPRGLQLQQWHFPWLTTAGCRWQAELGGCVAGASAVAPSSPVLCVLPPTKASGHHQRGLFQKGVLDTGAARAWLNSITQSCELCQQAPTRTYWATLTKRRLQTVPGSFRQRLGSFKIRIMVYE